MKEILACEEHLKPLIETIKTKFWLYSKASIYRSAIQQHKCEFEACKNKAEYYLRIREKRKRSK